MSVINVSTEVELNDLAEQLGHNMSRILGPSQVDVIEFVVNIDSCLGDLDFTKELHRVLGEIIEFEEGHETWEGRR
ncbi:hypothetical protein [Spirillospora sp. CA-294931]|uniref:hypothetical protein n=1 Tax=Spirillospora sp. CA-294931 TaxID=3240042 RepID=UPI003D8AD0FE